MSDSAEVKPEAAAPPAEVKPDSEMKTEAPAVEAAKTEAVVAEAAVAEAAVAEAAVAEAPAAEAVKTEAAAPAEVKEVAELDPLLKKQIEFYFSDSNLPKDKFLLNETKKTPEGWVSLKKISEFKKMCQMEATVPKLVAAVKASEFLAVDDKEENVRRTTPLPDSDVTIPRSIVAEKFPLETTIDDLQTFFSTHAPVLSVRLIKISEAGFEAKDGAFKGAAYVEFDTEESAKKVAAQEISYKEEKITMKSKADHITAAKEARAAAKGKDDGKEKDSKKRSRDSSGGDEKGGENKREKRDRAPKT